MTTDPTNAARQARFRKARALGLEYVAGYLPPKRAARVRQWLAEAEQDEATRQNLKNGRPGGD